ncbi:tape measure protein [Erwinia sp. S43]|uniref:tape measure protein n=1 Tax=Erwinia sp. S43 TaxID=2769339 RepID=UPI00190CA947|nr:tape measure protein [Erwinia sp. S43]MBK0031703.1 tape measure protein [Erwinia sp. S43]
MPENAGGIYYDIEMDVRGLLTAQQRVNQRLDLMERGFDSTTRAVNDTERSMTSLTGVAVALSAALSVRQVSEYADAWATVNNKLANSLRPNEQLAEVTERVFNITQQTRGSLDATASLYARLERATRQYGTSAGDLSKLTTIINQGFVVSGATAQEAENAIIQLSQGLASGALRGEEFNSVNEQGNRLIVALADSMGVSIGEMRNMAAQGKLTTDVVVNGLLSQGAVIGKEFANTTTTISQALQVAGNNVTKFFGENSTVKTSAGIFNDAVVTASENIGVLGGVLTAVVAIMGSRYVAALTMAGTAQAKKARDTFSAMLATRASAREEAAAAKITATKAKLDRDAADSALRFAQAELVVARGTNAESTALANVIRLRGIYVASAAEAAVANNALAASQARVAATGLTWVNAWKALNLLTAPLGGLVGALTLAAAATFYFYQKAQQAKQEALDFAEGLDRLNDAMKSMSNTQLRGTIADSNESIRAQKEEIGSLEKDIADLQSRYEKIGPEAEEAARRFGNLETYLRTSAEVTDNLNKKTRDLAEAREKLARTENTQAEANRLLTNNMQASMGMHDGLIEKGTTLERVQGAVAKAFGLTADEINRANQAGQNFKPTSLQISPATKEGAKYIEHLEEQNKLLKIQDERQRAVTQAKLEAEKTTSNSNQIADAQRLAGENFDLKKAEEERRKEQKRGEQQDKKSVSSAESVAQKLASLQQQAALTADSTQELTRAQAIQRAGESLGKTATSEQVKQAQDYAAAIWDTAAAIKARNAIPELKENADYTAQKSQLEMLKSATDANGKLLISQEQYSAASEQLEQEHQVRLSKIRAQQVSANPIAEARGEIDPVQALANQNNQKLALMQQYQQQEQAMLQQSYQQGKITYDQFIAAKSDTDAQYLALRTAQEAQFNQQMTAAQWELLSQQGLGYNMLTSAVDSFAGNASNALTGLLTGTMSAQEAMRSLGNTILNSVLNSIVQTGVEMLKNFIISQTLGAATQAANAAAAVAGGAAALAAWTPAAIAASIATAGTASATGLTAYQTAQTAGLAMSVLGARKNGGPVSAGGLYQVGEGGRPEIYQASNGSQYMIPGDNGKVLSNKDISGGGGITIINQIENYSSGAMVDTQASSDGNGNVTIQTIVTDIANGGQIGQAISNYHNAPRRARG